MAREHGYLGDVERPWYDCWPRPGARSSILPKLAQKRWMINMILFFNPRTSKNSTALEVPEASYDSTELKHTCLELFSAICPETEVLGVKGTFYKEESMIGAPSWRPAAGIACSERVTSRQFTENKRAFGCHAHPANSTIQSINPEMAAAGPTCWTILSQVGYFLTTVINTFTSERWMWCRDS